MDPRPESVRINGHAQECISDSQGIGAAGFRASRKFCDVGDIG